MKTKSSRRRPWSANETETLRERYPHENTRDIAKMLRRSLPATQQKARKIGLRKSEAYLQSAASGRRQKGHVPWNKGIAFPAKGSTSDHWFKKFHKPHNTKYDGCITLRKDAKTGRMYPCIRLQEGIWEKLHVNIWKKKHGKVPTGHVVVFRDGDTLNQSIENLELITRAELMVRNSIQNVPRELRRNIILTAKLKRKLKEYASQ